jgi:hypothetical protein
MYKLLLHFVSGVTMCKVYMMLCTRCTVLRQHQLLVVLQLLVATAATRHALRSSVVNAVALLSDSVSVTPLQSAASFIQTLYH